MVTIFKENLNLWLLRIFYSSIMFIFKTAKKAFHGGGTNFFPQIYGRLFYMGSNDQIMQLEKKFHKCIFQ